MSRVLVCLSCVQSICLAYLVYTVSVESRPPGYQPSGPTMVHRVEHEALPDTAVPTDAGPDLKALVRAAVREELDSYLGESQAAPAAASAEVPVVPVENDDSAGHKILKGSINGRMDYYSSVGRISADEMQTLQRDIARLPPSERRDALKRLVQALNSGEIEGRL